MSSASESARRSSLRLMKFYRAKAHTMLGKARQARWVGREGAVASLLAEALWYRRSSKHWAMRAQQEAAP